MRQEKKAVLLSKLETGTDLDGLVTELQSEHELADLDLIQKLYALPDQAAQKLSLRMMEHYYPQALFLAWADQQTEREKGQEAKVLAQLPNEPIALSSEDFLKWAPALFRYFVQAKDDVDYFRSLFPVQGLKRLIQLWLIQPWVLGPLENVEGLFLLLQSEEIFEVLPELKDWLSPQALQPLLQGFLDHPEIEYKAFALRRLAPMVYPDTKALQPFLSPWLAHADDTIWQAAALRIPYLEPEQIDVFFDRCEATLLKSERRCCALAFRHADPEHFRHFSLELNSEQKGRLLKWLSLYPCKYLYTHSLNWIGYPTLKGFEALIQNETERDHYLPGILEILIEEFVEWKMPAQQIFKKLLKHRQPKMRALAWAALRSCYGLKTEIGQNWIQAGLNDPDPEVQAATLRFLPEEERPLTDDEQGDISTALTAQLPLSPRALLLALKTATTEESIDLLGEIHAQVLDPYLWPQTPPKHLLQRVCQDSKILRLRALSLLFTIWPYQSLPLARLALNDPFANIRTRAGAHLIQYQAMPSGGISRLLRDRDPDVRLETLQNLLVGPPAEDMTFEAWEAETSMDFKFSSYKAKLWNSPNQLINSPQCPQDWLKQEFAKDSDLKSNLLEIYAQDRFLHRCFSLFLLVHAFGLEIEPELAAASDRVSIYLLQLQNKELHAKSKYALLGGDIAIWYGLLNKFLFEKPFMTEGEI